MANYGYRLGGEFDWCSSSGTALIVIENPANSGKKVEIGTFEIHPMTVMTGAGLAATLPTILSLSRATVGEGFPVPEIAMDSDAGALSPDIRVEKQNPVSSVTGTVTRVSAHKVLGNSLGWAAMNRPYGYGRTFKARRASSELEGLIIRGGESVALYSSTFTHTTPLRVTVTFKVLGSPSRTWTTTYFTSVQSPDKAVFSLSVASGSSEVVDLRSVAIEEVGGFDTPYFQLVPVGAIQNLDDSYRNRTSQLVKMDSSYPDPSSFLKVYVDVPVLPSGMPQSAFSAASTGSPKGFSYLSTKDFLGPVFKVLFPEVCNTIAGGASGVLGNKTMRGMSLIQRRSPIVLREGEAIALVSAAETAAGATSAVGVSGWASFELGAQLRVSPKITPTLTLSGLKVGTEVRVFRAGTATEVAGDENVVSGSFSWTFDPEDTPSVDIAVLSLGYQNLRILAVSLGLADVTIPVQQQVDRQFLNP